MTGWQALELAQVAGWTLVLRLASNSTGNGYIA